MRILSWLTPSTAERYTACLAGGLGGSRYVVSDLTANSFTAFISYNKMGSNISIICCARLESQPCCHVEEEEEGQETFSSTDSYQTILPDT